VQEKPQPQLRQQVQIAQGPQQPFSPSCPAAQPVQHCPQTHHPQSAATLASHRAPLVMDGRERDGGSGSCRDRGSGRGSQEAEAAVGRSRQLMNRCV